MSCCASCSGQEELRDLIDPGALAQVEDDLQFLSDRSAARRVATALHDVLRGVGDLTAAEAALRVVEGLDAAAMLEELRRERRAIGVRLAGEERWIDAADAGLYRDALGAAPPGGLPAAFLEDVPDALARLVRRYAATHGPFTADDLRARYGVDCPRSWRGSSDAGELVRGELRPGGTEREWCDPEVLRRLRRASLAVLRKEVEPVDDAGAGALPPRLAGRRPPSGDRRRGRPPARGAGPAPGAGAAGRGVGARRPPATDRRVLAGVDGSAVRGGRARVDRRGRAGAAIPAGSPCTSAKIWLCLARRPRGREAGAALESPAHEAVRARLAAGACFFTDLLVDVELAPEEIQEALWDLAWAGEATNDAFAPLRAPRLTLARAQRERVRGAARPGAVRGPPARRGRLGAGPGSLVADRAAVPRGGRSEARRRRAIAELLLERYGILTREQVRAEGLPGGFSGVYPELSQLETLGVARRGYFVEGLGGAQFALPGAVERLRAASSDEETPVVLAAVDPAQPYGAALPWPERAAEDARRLDPRGAGAYVVLAGGEPILYLERGGPGVADAGGGRRPADRAGAARAGRTGPGGTDHGAWRSRRWTGSPALISPLGPALVALGFQQGPRRLTLSA